MKKLLLLLILALGVISCSKYSYTNVHFEPRGIWIFESNDSSFKSYTFTSEQYCEFMIEKGKCEDNYYLKFVDINGDSINFWINSPQYDSIYDLKCIEKFSDDDPRLIQRKVSLTKVTVTE